MKPLLFAGILCVSLFLVACAKPDFSAFIPGVVKTNTKPKQQPKPVLVDRVVLLNVTNADTETGLVTGTYEDKSNAEVRTFGVVAPMWLILYVEGRGHYVNLTKLEQAILDSKKAGKEPEFRHKIESYNLIGYHR